MLTQAMLRASHNQRLRRSNRERSLIGLRLAIRLSGLILLDRMCNPARCASQVKQRILGTQPDLPAHEDAHERKAGFQVLDLPDGCRQRLQPHEGGVLREDDAAKLEKGACARIAGWMNSGRRCESAESRQGLSVSKTTDYHRVRVTACDSLDHETMHCFKASHSSASAQRHRKS